MKNPNKKYALMLSKSGFDFEKGREVESLLPHKKIRKQSEMTAFLFGVTKRIPKQFIRDMLRNISYI